MWGIFVMNIQRCNTGRQLTVSRNVVGFCICVVLGALLQFVSLPPRVKCKVCKRFSLTFDSFVAIVNVAKFCDDRQTRALSSYMRVWLVEIRAEVLAVRDGKGVGLGGVGESAVILRRRVSCDAGGGGEVRPSDIRAQKEGEPSTSDILA